MPPEQEFIASSELCDGVFVLGVLQSGVTLYKQQVRSHNLIWALDKTSRLKSNARIAIVGGGASGLTVASAALQKFPKIQVAIFERHADLCPLQLGCDTRWLHPRIYDWPELESRSPSTSLLPTLGWRHGRASDVASQILNGFGQIAKEHSTRLSVRLEVEYLRLSITNKQLDWIGQHTKCDTGFFQKYGSIGSSDHFDLIVLATGFGREVSPDNLVDRLYWQNDFFAQPELSKEKKNFLISGTGDGALVDLFRLTIERFRQDRILDELFKKSLGSFERKFRLAISQNTTGKPWMDLFDDLLNSDDDLKAAHTNLGGRIRSDTKVLLNISGPNGDVKDFAQTLQAKSSVLNKLIAFLLFRNGAFIPVCGSIDQLIKSYSIDTNNVICRHGVETKKELIEIVIEDVKSKLDCLKDKEQSAVPLWELGYFSM